jgi:hypothetical protein
LYVTGQYKMKVPAASARQRAANNWFFVNLAVGMN